MDEKNKVPPAMDPAKLSEFEDRLYSSANFTPPSGFDLEHWYTSELTRLDNSFYVTDVQRVERNVHGRRLEVSQDQLDNYLQAALDMYEGRLPITITPHDTPANLYSGESELVAVTPEESPENIVLKEEYPDTEIARGKTVRDLLEGNRINVFIPELT